MNYGLGEQRWAAIRAICEGATPTHERVACVAGVHVKTLKRRSGGERWKTLDFRGSRIRAAHRDLIELAARAAAGEELDPVDMGKQASAGDDLCGEAAGTTLVVIGAEAPAPLAPLPDETPEQRMARICEMLVRQTDAMLRRAEMGRPLEGRQVAALSAMTQLAERVAVIAREHATVRAQETEEKRRDVHIKIDNRILYMAINAAEWILVERCGLSAENARRLILTSPQTPEEKAGWCARMNNVGTDHKAGVARSFREGGSREQRLMAPSS